ncbi:hypothetical protein XELAEV_18032716mg [Xenopus laevis]|uniref:Uncharacterized protein n=1 Tax=Xenopus laevis TaxID=8355 RepID=A0A974CIY8_XENLA|nr:hypothetical protein XELAEV_18032716mg [Xenopus laevis]
MLGAEIEGDPPRVSFNTRVEDSNNVTLMEEILQRLEVFSRVGWRPHVGNGLTPSYTIRILQVIRVSCPYKGTKSLLYTSYNL